MEIVIGIIGLVLALAGYAVPEITTLTGTKAKNKLNSIAKDLYTKIKDNDKLLETLYNAYNQKQTGLMNSILQGAGFGARAASLKRELVNATKTFENKRKEISDENARLTNQYNEANNSLATVGTSITANVQAQNKADEIEQNINGGLKDTNVQG